MSSPRKTGQESGSPARETKTAFFRFYAELNDFLPAHSRQKTVAETFGDGQTVKHLIEALGVPHTEIDLILVNGEPTDLSYQVQDGDRVSVYPPFESIDIMPLTSVRPSPLVEPRFILDGHLGRLAAYLRMVGFDTLYRNDYDDEALARISSEDHRILLTRDRGLLKRSIVTRGYWLRQTDPRAQLVEVLRRFDLFDRLSPFTRCLSCNGLLQPIPKEVVADRLPPDTRKTHDEFRVCRACGQVFWDGSHVERMRKLIEWVLEQRRES
jgi:uncharacterized protein with PIN domain/sulfur carrier protein ThiS